MTNKKKWDDELPGCFGSEDKQFARHPLDEGRAYRWLGVLLENGATWNNAQSQMRAYLTEEKCDEAHINAEISYAQQYIYPWLKKD